MQLVVSRYVTTAALIIHWLSANTCNASTIQARPRTTATPPPNTTCEFRTINYITDTLPQSCLKSLWGPSNSTISTKGVVPTGEVTSSIDGEAYVEAASAEATISQEGIAFTSNAGPSGTAASAAAADSIASESVEASTADAEHGELNDASFLSFEDWKKQALEKAGQKGLDIGVKKSLVGSEEKNRDSESIHNQLDSLGEDGEIELDFGGFGRRPTEPVPAQLATSTEAEVHDDEAGSEVGQTNQYRSKDAGRTCKERFSYASFDAGATILKHHPGAKNSKAVLVENKDSYMLSECAAGNKFLIIELSEDIWIDTLVLANYEFFSSMIRTFRVSVSDRYPVKMDKWKDAGMYEARNSRDIQAFLIENPQIWARYIRIEFLSHYGSEYYCPLSLVRVHGTRMLEFWKETEAANEEEVEGIDGPGSEEYVLDAIAEVVREEERSSAERKGSIISAFDSANTAPTIPQCTQGLPCALEGTPAESSTFPWCRRHQLLNPDQVYEVCLASEVPSSETVEATITQTTSIGTKPLSIIHEASETHLSTMNTIATSITTSTPGPSASVTTPEVSQPARNATAETKSSGNDTPQLNSAHAISTRPEASRGGNITNIHSNKTTSTTTSSNASPTQQESFFKAVTRRLQLLEANSTLSLKYIEEQSRILRDAFSKVEKKQLSKTTSFLQTLNATVMAELQGFRQQYDEIWQSTVISLQNQREESAREILAISSRLNILADEVVFQKRMSIIQSIILLLCLGLVIFSRVSANGTGHLELPTRPHTMRTSSQYPMESPIESPVHGTGDVAYSQGYLSAKHERQKYHEPGDITMRDFDDTYSLGTPISSYEGSDYTTIPILMRSPTSHLGRRALTRSTSEQSPPRIHTYSSSSDSNGPSLQRPSPTWSLTRRRKELPSPPASSMSPDSNAWGMASGVSNPSSSMSEADYRQRLTPRDVSSLDVVSSSVGERGRQELHLIARKPLPALPQEDRTEDNGA